MCQYNIYLILIRNIFYLKIINVKNIIKKKKNIILNLNVKNKNEGSRVNISYDE